MLQAEKDKQKISKKDRIKINFFIIHHLTAINYDKKIKVIPKLNFFMLKVLIFSFIFDKIVKIIFLQNGNYILKKLVLKTIAITLALTLCAMMIAFGVTSLFAPKFVAGVFDGVGNYSASVFFYEKQYEKTSDIKDLATLIDKIDRKKEPVKAENYLVLMTSHEGFEEFCKGADGKQGKANKEYYFGNYALVLVDTGRFSKAVEVSKEFITENGYTENNPIRLLISECAETASVKELNELKTAITIKKYTLTSAQKKLAEYDIEDIKTDNIDHND